MVNSLMGRGADVNQATKARPAGVMPLLLLLLRLRDRPDTLSAWDIVGDM